MDLRRYVATVVPCRSDGLLFGVECGSRRGECDVYCVDEGNTTANCYRIALIETLIVWNY